MKEYEAIVIGGGPAGVSATYELTKRGHEVLLIEMEEDYPKVPKDWCVFGEIFKLYPWLKGAINNHIDRIFMGAGSRKDIIDGSGPWNLHNYTEAYGEKWLFHVFDDKFLGAWMEKNQEQGAIYRIGEKVITALAGTKDIRVKTNVESYKCKKLIDCSGAGLVVPLEYELSHLGSEREIRPYGKLPWYWEVNCIYTRGFYQLLDDLGVTDHDLALITIGRHNLPTLCKANSGYGHAFYPWNEEDVCHEMYYVTNIWPGAPEWSIEADWKNYWENWAYPGRSYEHDMKTKMYRKYKGYQQLNCYGPFSLENNRIFLAGDTMGGDNHCYTGAGVSVGIMFGAAAGEYVARLLDGETEEQLGPYDGFIYSRRFDGPNMREVPVEQTMMNRDAIANIFRNYMIAGGKALSALGYYNQKEMNRFTQGLMTKEDILKFFRSVAKSFPKDMLKETLFPRPYIMENAWYLDKKYNIGIFDLLKDYGIKRSWW